MTTSDLDAGEVLNVPEGSTIANGSAPASNNSNQFVTPVVAPSTPENLPQTGSDAGLLATTASVIFIAGFGLTWATRRRRLM